ncbi:hypothetical protein SBRY_160053 [Actinacidiphila bryophytorum]|uniref:Uncharacterized protein n=1 Tax=Actinacidiphila bryophytorum TaxID=1436133 RepID=A0A9W4E6N6_9ACTN|nr:hypothetical protein SBRY_160053 [Actinacidiphila bryophytorum]
MAPHTHGSTPTGAHPREHTQGSAPPQAENRQFSKYVSVPIENAASS